MKKIAVVLCGMEYSNQQELVQGIKGELLKSFIY